MTNIFKWKEEQPKEIQTRIEFIEEFIKEHRLDISEIKGKRYMLCFKINIGNVPYYEGQEYCNKASEALNQSPDLKDRFISFVTPIRNGENKMTIVDLVTMKYVEC